MTNSVFKTVGVLVLTCLIYLTSAQHTFDLSVYTDTMETKTLLNEVLRKVEAITGNPSPLKDMYMDCADIKSKVPGAGDGVYEITNMYSKRSMRVYCDMTSDGGGWTVVQRRKDGSLNFTKNWFQYKYGFGDPSGEFWLGNENLYHLTNQDMYRLQIDLKNFQNEDAHAMYDYFYIEKETSNYTLHLGEYLRYSPEPWMDAGDGLTELHNGRMFSTWDVDNDEAVGSSCVTHPDYMHSGGWWFGNCDRANLNGQYLKQPQDARGNRLGSERNIEWGSWRNNVHWISETVMKLRPKTA